MAIVRRRGGDGDRDRVESVERGGHGGDRRQLLWLSFPLRLSWRPVQCTSREGVSEVLDARKWVSHDSAGSAAI